KKEKLKREIDETNICFLHAPMFHPALKTVGPIRKNLGMRTFFNMLGPMVNPAFPKFQLVGVFNLEMARIYNYLLQQGEGAFTIIHGLDGYDEISLTNDTKVITNQGEVVMTPEHSTRAARRAPRAGPWSPSGRGSAPRRSSYPGGAAGAAPPASRAG